MVAHHPFAGVAIGERHLDLSVTPFTVGGIQHYWTYLQNAEWTGDKVAAALTPLIEEHIRFWGSLPYKKYAFLDINTSSGGGSAMVRLWQDRASIRSSTEPS